MILYGISTCDTCKKAIKALQGAGHDVQFRDVRTQPLTESEWAMLIGEFGDLLVNRKSTTYRGFSDFMRLSEADVQLPAHPAVMKRPVIQSSDAWYLGWEDKVQAALLS